MRCSPTSLSRRLKGAHHDSAPTPNDRGHEAPQLRARHHRRLRQLRRTLRHALRQVARAPRPRAMSAPTCSTSSSRSVLLELLQPDTSALRFLYDVTLSSDWVLEHLVCPKQPKKLPVVLSPDEVTQFFAAIAGLKHRAILMTAYAAGLRVSEVVALRVDDIDSRRMVIRRPPGQGAQGSLRHALAPAARGPPRVLEGGPPDRLALPGQRARSADHRRARCRRRAGEPVRGRGAGQARHRPHAAAQLRDPPARGRHRHPDHPGPARPPQPHAPRRVYTHVSPAALQATQSPLDRLPPATKGGARP